MAKLINKKLVEGAGTTPNKNTTPPTTQTQPTPTTQKNNKLTANTPPTTTQNKSKLSENKNNGSTGNSLQSNVPQTRQPFSYDPFTYNQTFSYDPFTYDKTFSYDPFSYEDFTYNDYVESETVKNANQALQQHLASKPGAYQSQWDDQINSYMDQIQNRDPFSYDFNSDALYQQYKDNYIQQGKMAMMDTMGQAQAMTGGYGNSYAQTVGQQAYNQQLTQLNDVIPELYQMAYNRYVQEGQDLKDVYSMLSNRENQDYGRYMDNMGLWTDNRDYLTGRYDTERDVDYGRWESNRNFDYNQYSDNRNLAYNQYSSDRALDYDMFTSDRALAYEQYSSDRALDYDMFTSDRDFAYNQYSDDRNLAYNDYQAGIEYDQWKTEFDADTQRWQTEFDEGTRRYEQNRADSQAQGSSGGGSTGGTVDDTHTYITLSLADMDAIDKKFRGFTTIEQALAYVETLIGMGYDPAIINSISKTYVGQYSGGNVTDTTVGQTGPITGAVPSAIEGRLNSATSIEEVDNWENLYKGRGYDEELARLAQAARNRILGASGGTTRNIGGGGFGGGGGGTSYNEAR